MSKVLLLSALVLLSLLSSAAGAETDFLVLEAVDPSGDQECVFHQNCDYGGGDIKGLKLTLEKIPLPRSRTREFRQSDFIYVPQTLELDLDTKLKGGETQLCIFIFLPPLYIEHIVVRNILARKNESGTEESVLLEGQEEFSFLLGLDPEKDKEIEALRSSGFYRDCLAHSSSTRQLKDLLRARRFSLHENGLYRFPPSPTFYWRDIPSVKISISLTVREINDFRAGGIAHLLNDAFYASWKATSGN